MPIDTRKSERAGGLPFTFSVRPSNTTPVRCFDSQLGSCRAVVFEALDDDGQTNVISVGDSSANATTGSGQGVGRKPGAVWVEKDIDPWDFFMASEGDSKHGLKVTATK